MNPENNPDELCLDFTLLVDGEIVELCENGKEIPLTKENKDEYIELVTDFYCRKQIEKQIAALKKGFTFTLDPSLFDNFSSHEIGEIICGEQKIDVEDLIANFDMIPPLTPEHPITQMFFNILRRWPQELLSKLLLFMTSAHIVPVGGYAFMKSKGRQPKLKLTSLLTDKMPLPSALTCFSHLSLPPYSSEEEMEKGLLTAITESEGFK